MAQDQPATTTVEEKEGRLWPTAVGLGVLVLGGVLFVRSLESAMMTAGLLIFAVVVTLGGVLFHGVRGLWSLMRGRRDAARGSLWRAVLYLVFGIVAFVGARQQGGSVPEFRASLEPGMSMQEALRRLDLLYTAHPRRYRFITLWGTPNELTINEYPRIAKEGEAGTLFTWKSGEVHSSGVVSDTAAVLSKSRQVWFTFRGDVGFVHFFVTLDERGLIKSISETTGHQA
jgi:hypothetical protein